MYGLRNPFIRTRVSCFSGKGGLLKAQKVIWETEEARRQRRYFAALERYGLPFLLADWRRNVAAIQLEGGTDAQENAGLVASEAAERVGAAAIDAEQAIEAGRV